MSINLPVISCQLCLDDMSFHHLANIIPISGEKEKKRGTHLATFGRFSLYMTSELDKPRKKPVGRWKKSTREIYQ